MLRSSFTAIRYRPDAVPRRFEAPRGGLLSGTGAPQARPDDPAPGARPGPMDSRVVLDADQIARACARIAHQILEANRGAENLVLMGIPTRGSCWPTGSRR